MDEDGWVPIRFPDRIPQFLADTIEIQRWIAHWRYVQGYWFEKARDFPGRVVFQDFEGVRVDHRLWRSCRQDMHLLVWDEDLALINGWPEPEEGEF